MTSSQHARESLGNLSDLFTGMLGTAITSGATPDTTPESKLATDIKNIISAESATARTSDMITAKLAAEKSIADYELGWTTPEKLEQSVIETMSKTLRFDARARAIDGLPAWDLDRMYTIETLKTIGRERATQLTHIRITKNIPTSTIRCKPSKLTKTNTIRYYETRTIGH